MMTRIAAQAKNLLEVADTTTSRKLVSLIGTASSMQLANLDIPAMLETNKSGWKSEVAGF